MNIETREGYVPQSIWDEPDAKWFDMGEMKGTHDEAKGFLNGCLSHYKPGKDTRKIKATRVVYRIIHDESCEP